LREGSKITGMGEHNTLFKICPACNYFCLKSEQNEFCPYCGEPLIDKCPVCKAEITIPYANYCSTCGSLYPGKKTANRN